MVQFEWLILAISYMEYSSDIHSRRFLLRPPVGWTPPYQIEELVLVLDGDFFVDDSGRWLSCDRISPNVCIVPHHELSQLKMIFSSSAPYV